MTVSRRMFLRNGSLCALFAGLALSPHTKVFGRGGGPGQDAGHFQVPPEAQTDPAFYFTRETFAPYVGGVFLISGDFGRPFEATLTEITDCRTAAQKVARGAGECFALHFRQRSGGAVPQDTRDIQHAALGRFRLLLVPGPAGREVSYTAIINHIGPS